ncbi:DUF4178 domain-containing protein [Flammeovirga aprica]|uniref:DUF4178 domain-containing protein n=1 Tax=Flammeovirga aprica JL-4 TaxID=694437 RepID=A0A7X9XC99_9BACT|nr:DUF4178 domain-containing protein [Flammeovirga aprica]NME71576.1 DUF4178 domain-containing protein [Flammeovirga aprica JL-4]
MPFGFFKKKKKEESHYDPTNIGIVDLRKGYVLDFDLQTWEVTEMYEYDWGDNDFSYEFKLESPSDTVFLSVDIDDIVTGTVSRKIVWGRLPEEVEDGILQKGKPPKQITFEGVTYYRDSRSIGYWRNTEETDRKDSMEYMCWEYYDDTEKKVLTLERFGEEEFEASRGIVYPPDAFSNVLPVS